MTAALDLNAIAQLSAERMVGCLVEGVILTAFAGLLLRLIGRQNSGTRFAVWFSVLLAIPALAVSGGAWASAPGSVPAATVPVITVPASWALYLLGTWALLAGAGLVRVAAGLWHLYRLRKSCIAVEVASLDRPLQEMLWRLQASRAVTICVSEQVQAPTAIGLLKPAVVIPEWLMRELSALELQQVMLHELTHLRRRDDWTNLVQKILKALLFFHPAVWWVEQRISLEREMACDDAVLAETADPRAYAQCLMHLAEKSLVRRSLALAQAAVSRIGQTSRRVVQILDGDRPRTTQVWKPAVSLVAVVLCTSLVFLAWAPRLVAFRDGTAGVVANAAAVVPVLQAAAKEPVPSGVQDAAPKPAPRRMQASPQAVAAKLHPRSSTALQRDNSAFESKLAEPTIAPAVVPARSADEGMMPPATFLVFVESRSYSAYGLVEWQVAVWRITVQQQTDNPAAKAITRKST